MTTVRLPALDGRSPLGFLAALGVVRLLDRFGDDEPRLSWDEADSSARLETSLSSLDAVADRLWRTVTDLDEGQLIPGVEKEFPPPGEAPDRLRLRPGDLRILIQDLDTPLDSDLEEWVTSLVTDLVVDDRGRSAISRMAAPSGKQSMFTMLNKPLQTVRQNPACIREALAGWRRYPGVTGEYLDHQVLFGAADTGDGGSSERGVPGATWLALMSYPLIRTTESDGQEVSTGWFKAGRTRMFLWPLWRMPLDVVAVQSLLDHPALRTSIDGKVSPALRSLGVFAVGRAQRRRISGRTFAGVLAPLDG